MNKYKTILSNIPAKPIVCYDFTNQNSYPTTGTVVTDIFNNSNATLSNSPIYSAFTSGSMFFDGSNDFLITTTSLNDLFSGTSPNKSETTSIFMWVYMMDDGVILSEQGTPTPNISWFESVIERVSGNLKFGLWNGSSISNVTSSASTSLNTWYHIGLTYDGSTMKSYVNSQLVGEVSFNRIAPYNGGANTYYAIASECPTNMGDGGYAKMYLSRFEIYNYVLSQTQISYNYNSTKNRFITPIVTTGVTFSETFTGGSSPSTAIENSWTTFRSQLTGTTYTKFDFYSSNGGGYTGITDSTKVQLLANALNTGTTGINFSTTISGLTWNVGCCTCTSAGNLNGAVEFANISLCSPSSTAALRPFIRNSNWGGIGSTVGASTQTLTLRFY